MGIFQMPRIIVHGNVYQRVGRKRQSGFVGCLYAKQTIESPVRPAEPPRVGNLAQCPDGAVRTRVHHGFGPRENSSHPVVEFSAGRQKTHPSKPVQTRKSDFVPYHFANQFIIPRSVKNKINDKKRCVSGFRVKIVIKRPKNTDVPALFPTDRHITFRPYSML